jgi:hypothetical protein
MLWLSVERLIFCIDSRISIFCLLAAVLVINIDVDDVVWSLLNHTAYYYMLYFTNRRGKAPVIYPGDESAVPCGLVGCGVYVGSSHAR